MSLKQAGIELVRGNVAKAFSQLINPSTYRGKNPLPAKSGNFDLMGIGGSGVGAFYSFNGLGSCLTAYDQCPPLQAVCNRRALAFINAEISIVNSLDKPSFSSQSKKVLKLLANPNPLQTRAAFLAQIHIYIDLVGYAVIAPIRPVGFEMAESDSFWVIPPAMCEIISKDNSLNFTTGNIDYIRIGNVNVNPADVMLITDINPSLTNMVLPGQKIRSLELPINNIIGAYESESTLIKHRGPTGLISNKISTALGAPIPLLPEEKERIQNAFNQRYGFLQGQSHIILTDAALDYQKTGFDAEELGLHNTIVNGTKTICDTIGWPVYLMGIVDATYANKESADKEVYTKYIIPSARNIAEQLASYLLPVSDKFIFDYSHCPELQKDKQKEATASKTETEDLILQFKMNAISMATFKTKKGLEEPLPGDEIIYYKDIKEIIDPKPGTTMQNQDNGNNNQNSNTNE